GSNQMLEKAAANDERGRLLWPRLMWGRGGVERVGGGREECGRGDTVGDDTIDGWEEKEEGSGGKRVEQRPVIKAATGRVGRKWAATVTGSCQWRQAMWRRRRRGDGGSSLRGCTEEEQRVMAAGVAASCNLRSCDIKEEGGAGFSEGYGV
ncbi:hypothetical protein BHM03_00053021, partial [Ensete ventricosum]